MKPIFLGTASELEKENLEEVSIAELLKENENVGSIGDDREPSDAGDGVSNLKDN